VLRGARTFSARAFGFVVNLSLFVAGGAVANLVSDRVFARLKRAAPFLLASGIALIVVAVFVIEQPIADAARSCFATLVGGLGAGLFWPVLIQAAGPEDRGAAYAADTYGFITGGLLFQAGLAGLGFQMMGWFGIAGFVLLSFVLLTAAFRRRTG
jgi:hypothetical protein